MFFQSRDGRVAFIVIKSGFFDSEKTTNHKKKDMDKSVGSGQAAAQIQRRKPERSTEPSFFFY